ncbi:MAG: HAMP domain-containing sensor histidine kinase [FCB group bacterium]|jgi:signal transduction histidine kinase
MDTQEQSLTNNLTARATDDELLYQINLIRNIKELKTFIDAVPEIYLILNRNRQIVFANKPLYKLIEHTNQNEVLGKRPGEVIGCQNAFETPDGCGTSEKCMFCGTLNSILMSLDSQPTIQEARLTNIDTGDAMDFRVWSIPYIIGEEKYAILTLSDISDEKRRNVLERIFFHDIMNTAGSLRGFARIINESPEEINEIKEAILILSEKLIDEINYQKQLNSAENNELLVEPRKINSIKLLKDIINLYPDYQVIKGQIITLADSVESVDFISDSTLLRRVILNITKNAVEASDKNQTITIGCYLKDEKVHFWVHNSNYMPTDIQLQLFKRSFSTKGSGRGLGTYSMKLLTERYLKGTISFTSTEEEGTKFTASYPLKLEVNS